jgi:hypothetical protein
MFTLSASIGTATPNAAIQAGGAVAGTPKTILRLEAAIVFAAACAAYARVGSGWGMFALLILVPDITMLGYLAGRRIGAATYNLGHTYVFPAALGVCELIWPRQLQLALALIWIAHIAFDRMLGYGLKYGTMFRHTHLGGLPAQA